MRVLVDRKRQSLNALEWMLGTSIGLGRKPVRMLSNKILSGRPSQVSFTRILSAYIWIYLTFVAFSSIVDAIRLHCQPVVTCPQNLSGHRVLVGVDTTNPFVHFFENLSCFSGELVVRLRSTMLFFLFESLSLLRPRPVWWSCPFSLSFPHVIVQELAGQS